MKHAITITQTMQRSKQWVWVNASTQKLKTVSPAGKVMETVFFDTHGLVLTDYSSGQKERVISSG